MLPPLGSAKLQPHEAAMEDRQVRRPVTGTPQGGVVVPRHLAGTVSGESRRPGGKSPIVPTGANLGLKVAVVPPPAHGGAQRPRPDANRGDLPRHFLRTRRHCPAVRARRLRSHAAHQICQATVDPSGRCDPGHSHGGLRTCEIYANVGTNAPVSGQDRQVLQHRPVPRSTHLWRSEPREGKCRD